MSALVTVADAATDDEAAANRAYAAFAESAAEFAAATRDPDGAEVPDDAAGWLSGVSGVVSGEVRALSLYFGDLWPDTQARDIATSAYKHLRAAAEDLAAVAGICAHVPKTDDHGTPSHPK